MNARNAPLSPVSLGDSDWPSSYSMDKEDQYGNRSQLISPPNSGGPMSPSMNGFPAGMRSGGGPSPPPSVGRSSTATNLYNRRESGRSQRDDSSEALLSEHYIALNRFLSQTSRDGKPTQPANKARDKLQRLTSVQFLELSTDVYDELIRRQTSARRPPNAPPGSGPPAYLLPEEGFHPKRNQARQKLASLGPPRFRDLATDVFCELERRFPHFIAADIPRLGSPSSIRTPSRAGTPVNGMYPPRGQSRRNPSEAGSIRSLRGPMMPGMGSVPPSPGMPPNGYGPMQKQSQSNTIVPNKSTMVEEDDDGVGSPMHTRGIGAFGSVAENSDLEKRTIEAEEEKKRLIGDYEGQLKELRDKMQAMETDMKRQKEDMDKVLEEERSRASAADEGKEEFTNVRRDLETKLADSQDHAENLQHDIDRMRNDHAAQERQLRTQIDELRQSLAESTRSGGAGDEDLARENEELRESLRHQQEVTEEVRGEAENFLKEMRVLSQQSGSTWEKQSELEKTIASLEAEVTEWRNRYARAKTQLRNMRASSMGLPMEENAGKYVHEKGFTADNGLIKDVHVTKFQIAVDDFLRQVRVESPDKAIDSMKVVVVSVRRITKAIKSGPQDGEIAQVHGKLRTRVSVAANNLITASKNYAMSAGLSPVSLVDAAASNLVAAVVELLRVVKIRMTPAGELEEEDDDEDGTMTPVDSSSFFSPQSNGAQTTASSTSPTRQDSLPPPPPFQGLGGIRNSTDSSAYSPVNSPRESVSQYGGGAPNGAIAGSYLGINKGGLPSAPNGYSMNGGVDRRTEDLKTFLDDQTAIMVQVIQDMVGAIRSDAPVEQVIGQINRIADTISKIIAETEASGHGGESLDKLMNCRQKLVEAGDLGEAMSHDTSGREMDWRSWTTTLPPIAFEIARETKELVRRIDRLLVGDTGDDFS